jgi:hypothetical protein
MFSVEKTLFQLYNTDDVEWCLDNEERSDGNLVGRGFNLF